MKLGFIPTIVLICLVASASAYSDDALPSFEKHIQPFFKTYCLGCHNGDDDSKGGLDLRTYQTLVDGGNGGDAFVAGKSAESRLVRMMLGTAKPKMPPKDSKQPKSEEIELVRRWIDAGAKGPEVATPLTADELKLPRVEPKAKVSAAFTTTAYSPDGKLLAAARHREVLLYDAAGKLAHTLAGAEHPINAIAFSPDGKFVAAGEGFASVTGRVCLWEIGGKEPRVFTGHADSIYAVAFSPDGKTLATGSYDKLVILWDIETGEPRHTLKHHTGAVFGVAFSPDGKTLASVAADQTVKLWNVANGQRLVTLTEATKGLSAVAFNPNGGELAAVGSDKMIRVWQWNGTTARLTRSAFAHDAPLLAMVYTPDGKTLFTSSEDRRVKAWDAVTLRERHVYENLDDWALALAVSPNGKQLVAGFYDGALSVFDVNAATRTREVMKAAKPQATASAVAVAQGKAKKKAEVKTDIPAAPRLDSISPRTAVRGKKVKLTFTGQNVWDADRIFVQPSSLAVTLLPGDEKAPTKKMCEVEIPEEMPPGLVQMRLHTPLGSTGAKSFYVGPFQEMTEKEPNNVAEKSAALIFPMTLLGAIETKGDRDLWRFDALTGQELTFQLVGNNLGSALSARITLLDADGTTLASVVRASTRSEVILRHRVERPGKYVLQVEDRNFTGSANHFYAIHAGEFALPEKTEAIAKTQASTPAETLEAEPNDAPLQAKTLSLPATVVGRIQSPHLPTTPSLHSPDADHFAFQAKRGERLTIEVRAGRNGSPLDSVLDVLTADGKPVGRHTLRAVAETYTVLRDHDSKVRGIRLHNWDDFQPNDLLMLGGEVVKVQILPLGPDEDVKFFEKNNQRLCFLGTTPQAHALSSPAYKVEVHPPGSVFPPNGMPVVPLNYTNDDGGPDFMGDSQILFDAPADGKYIVRLRDVRGLASDDFTYRLSIRPRQEDYRISLDQENPNIPRGGSRPITVNCERLDGFSGPIDLTVDGLPPGITATAGRIHPDAYFCTVTLTAAEDAPPMTDGTDLRMKVHARATIDGHTVEHDTTPLFGMHQVTVTSPPDLLVRVEPAIASLSPGQEQRFTVTIDRKNGLKSRVPIDVLNLPHGLRVLDVGLNGVLITEDTVSRTFVVHCDPWAAPGPHTFYAAGRVEAKANERHASSPLRIDVKANGAVAATAN